MSPKTNYKYIIAARSKKVILKQITELVFDYFGGINNAAAAIKNFSKNKNKIAGFFSNMTHNAAVRTLVYLLSYSTAWSVANITDHPIEAMSVVFKTSSKNQDKPELDESDDAKSDSIKNMPKSDYPNKNKPRLDYPNKNRMKFDYPNKNRPKSDIPNKRKR